MCHIRFEEIVSNHKDLFSAYTLRALDRDNPWANLCKYLLRHPHREKQFSRPSDEPPSLELLQWQR